jgi:hypothetical protein
MKTWNHFKLRFEHPARWWIDIYLIDAVFKNTVAKYRNELQLWRFHRRSAPDGSRHQFSFLCYTEDENSSRIREDIFNHSPVALLEQSNLLIEKLYEVRGSKIEDTSDPTWPIEIKKSWPYYIMGVSEMLINLIGELKPSLSSYDDNDIRSIEIYYSELIIG